MQTVCTDSRLSVGWVACVRVSESSSGHNYLFAQVQGAAEVDQLQVAALVQQQVFRLEIPVNNLATKTNYVGFSC